MSKLAKASPRPSGTAELTLRGVLLGGVITLLFTAANVYIGLKVGLTFATSIPAAVISMAVLRYFKGATIWENNIVQTVASAAGTLAAIAFVLPGLVMIGWWQGFPYWTTFLITLTGGVLGVTFSVPLRRALVLDAPLPYPEGRAAAEVLQLGAGSREGEADAARGLAAIVWSSIVSAGFAVLTATRLAVAEAALWFRVGSGATGVSGGLSFALLGVGHLVGLTVGAAMGLGLVLGWWVLLPILTARHPATGSVETWANGVFRDDVRFFGAGVIGVAAVWTLLRIAGPVLGGIRSAIASSRARAAGERVALEERDLPVGIVAALSLLTLVPIGWLLWSLVRAGPLAPYGFALVAGGLVFVLVIGLMIAAVCGYMAGLIGASNSPVSGIGILSVIAASLLLLGLVGRGQGPDTTQAIVAYALIVTAVVFSVATISNDNLQDLKTGQLIGATPWKQQVALLIGVAFGAAVIPPVLSLMNSSFGFVGAPGAGPNALAAPQAGLISALAKGVLGGGANWPMVELGVAVGALLVAIDEGLTRRTRFALPPLAVGIGIYLPQSVILPTVLGSVLGWLYERWADRTRDPERARRTGVLTATGMIVGESLWGVVFAGIVAASGSDAPLALIGGWFDPYALAGGTAAFAALTWALYGYARRIGIQR